MHGYREIHAYVVHEMNHIRDVCCHGVGYEASRVFYWVYTYILRYAREWCVYMCMCLCLLIEGCIFFVLYLYIVSLL